MRKRVVVTGLSAICPLGNDLDTAWDNLVQGKSGISRITQFDATGYDTQIAGEVKNFNPEEFGISAKQAKRMDRFTQFGVAASMKLMEHSGFKIDDSNAEDVAVHVGVGIGGLATIEAFAHKLFDSGPNRVSPFFIPMLISNMAPGQMSIFTGARGPNLVACSACASGLHALGYAYTDIVLGRTRAAITGGVESTITPMGISGFTAMKALSTRNDEPEKASRPFDLNRDGFVAGEGAGLLFIEDLESAQARGAAIYAEMLGYGSSGDAYHITAPKEDGSGMIQAMRAAIKDAGLTPDDIDHINAHGTSTHHNDLGETIAIKAVFGERAYKIPVVSNKSQTGHLLGAAGGLESLFAVLTLHNGLIPGTINYETPDPELDLDYVTAGPRKQQVEYVLCNNFGFGGTNACVVYKRWTGK